MSLKIKAGGGEKYIGQHNFQKIFLGAFTKNKREEDT